MKKVNYTVRTTENAITGEKQTVPVVVNRRDPVDLAEVVTNCIDRNLILGAKPTAAQGIAEGIAEQLATEFRRGNGVKFGKYFYGRLYLDGTTNQNGDLGEDNRVNVRLYKGEDFKLGLDDFAFSFVNGGDLPDVEFCVGCGGGVRDELDQGNALIIYGANLFYGDDAAVKVKLEGETGAVVEFGGDALSAKSAEQLIVPATALPPLALTNGTWKVTVERTTADGKQLYGKSGHILCVGFGPQPGPTPIDETSDGKCRVVTLTDGESASEFTLGNAWVIGGRGLYDIGAPEGEWEYDAAKLTVGGVEVAFAITFSGDGTSGTFGEHSGVPTPGTYENVTMSYTVVRGEETETLTIPIPRLVVTE